MIENLPHRTNRLILRNLCVSDIDAFHGYRSREDVAELQGWAPMTRSEALEFLHTEDSGADLRPGSWHQIGIAVASSNTIIGDIGIHLSADQRTVEFGLSIHPEHQGLGLGTEAVLALIELLFRHTSVNTITAATDDQNIPCIRLLEKVGMRHIVSRTAEYKGKHCTERVFSKNREPCVMR